MKHPYIAAFSTLLALGFSALVYTTMQERAGNRIVQALTADVCSRASKGQGPERAKERAIALGARIVETEQELVFSFVRKFSAEMNCHLWLEEGRIVGIAQHETGD